MEAEQIQHIEDYLDGRMDRKKLASYFSELKTDELEQEIEWVRNARLAVEMNGLRTQLKEVFETEHKETPIVRRMKLWRPVLAIAAALAILLAIYLGLNSRSTTPSLYASYAYKAPNLPMLMSQSENYTLYDALTFYGEGNFEEASRRLMKVKEGQEANDTVNFYLGASLLYEGKSAESKAFLEDNSLENSSFQAQAAWLLVLAYLKEENYPKTREYLQPILEDQTHPFYNQALQLMKDVEGR